MKARLITHSLLLIVVILFSSANSYAQTKEDWIARYNGPGNSNNDGVVSVKTDATGSVYVLGYSFSGGSNIQYDFSVIKFNTLGDTIWQGRYHPAETGSKPVDMAIDADGNNIYVTGYEGKSGVLIKFNNTGKILWTQDLNIYDDDNGIGHPVAIGVDNAGNTYITGFTKMGSFKTYSDFVTMKYNTDGVKQWLKPYGEVGQEDQATNLLIDHAGNIYVAGWVANNSAKRLINYALVKYNSKGDTLWATIYRGQYSGLNDFTKSITVDANDNVYVTGYGGAYDDLYYLTLKYDSSGTMLWDAQYTPSRDSRNKAVDIKADASGNVYVTGTSDSDPTYDVNQPEKNHQMDVVTIKYDNMGTPLWTKTYNSNNADDRPLVMEQDDAGNLYILCHSKADSVNGSNYILIKYNSLGDTLWTKQVKGISDPDTLLSNSMNHQLPDIFNHHWIAFDKSGNLFAGGITPANSRDNDMLLIAFDAATGSAKASATYNGPKGNGREYATAMAADNAGNIYVTGFRDGFGGSGRDEDMLTIKYNASGEQQWAKVYDGPGKDEDHANAIAVDNAGNSYVAGYSSGIGTQRDMTVVKYDVAGNQLWEVRYNGPGNKWDEVKAITIDGNANVYVTGYTDVGNGQYTYEYNYLTIKYDSSGVQKWVARYDGPGTDYEEFAKSIAVDGNENVFITGKSSGKGTSYDITTIKYNSSGDTMWTQRYPSTANTEDGGNTLKIDDAGNVYVAGAVSNNGTSDFITLKYNSSGVQQWVKTYNGTQSYIDEANDLVVDANGNVYVTGYTNLSTFTTIKYDAGGTELWVKSSGDPAYYTGKAKAIALDAAGNVYVTGGNNVVYASQYELSDYVTIKYSNSGEEIGVAHYSGPSGNYDTASDLFVDASGNVYVTGYSYDPATYMDIITLKYSNFVASSVENSFTANSNIRFYPNPFRTGTTLYIQNAELISGLKPASFKLYDVLGNEAIKMEIKSQQVAINGEGLAEGLYFYQLIFSNQFVLAGKLIIE